MRRATAVWTALLVAGALAAACAESGEEGEPATVSEARSSTVAEPPERDPAPGDGRNSNEGRDPAPVGADQDSGDRASESEAEAEERIVQRAASRYIAALSNGDGAAVCAALAAGAIDDVELPKTREGCAASLDASIGYRDPRSIPVFAGAELVAFEGLELSGDSARVTATVVTDFADRDEPSIEDDVIYLTLEDTRWLVAKASPTLYRAIGAAEVPPHALSPPE